DLRPLFQLRTLELRSNSLATTASLPNSLPSSLSSLGLGNNELATLSDLRYLSSLMELRALDLRANPFASAATVQGVDYRPFLVFLLPRVTTLDGEAVPRSAVSESRLLFTDDTGRLSDTLMALLQPANERRLRAYLEERCPLAARDRALVRRDEEGVGGGRIEMERGPIAARDRAL
ncbi:hypothetical protein T484DRAFT_1801653, partial [Baffinella frigidus]